MVSPGTPCSVSSILANGATRSFFGMRADTISPITSGSISSDSFVMKSDI